MPYFITPLDMLSWLNGELFETWWTFLFSLMNEILTESYTIFVSYMYFVCHNFINIFPIKIYALSIASHFLETRSVATFYWIVLDIFLSDRLVCFFWKITRPFIRKFWKRRYARTISIWCIRGRFIGAVLWLIVLKRSHSCSKPLVLKFSDLR